MFYPVTVTCITRSKFSALVEAGSVDEAVLSARARFVGMRPEPSECTLNDILATNEDEVSYIAAYGTDPEIADGIYAVEGPVDGLAAALETDYYVFAKDE